MRFVILIHSNPHPWAHPTSGHTAEYQALPQEEKDRLQAHWEEVYGRAEADGEVVYHCALADPASSVVLRYGDRPVATDGPYAESTEHLAGFFVVEVDSRERAVEIAEAFSCPGDTVEVRPAGGECRALLDAC